MTRLARPSVALAALALATAIGGAPAESQTWEQGLILSNDWGSGEHIAASEDLRKGLDPVPLSGEEVVAEFKRLCLDTNFDAEAHAKAALASSWRFRRHEALLPRLGKLGEFAFVDYRSGNAITSLWRGENGPALKGRFKSYRSRGAIITGPVSVKDLHAPQCNLSLRTSGLGDAAPLAAALEQALAGPAAKIVLKASFADGNWKIAGPSGEARRVSFDVVDMKKATQLVHLTVQTLPEAKP